MKQYASGLHQRGHFLSPLAPLYSFCPLLLCDLPSWLASFLIVYVRVELVVVSSLMVLTRLSIVSFFAVAAMARVSNDSPSFSATYSRTCCLVLLMATAAFALKPASPVVSLLSSSTWLRAARKYFLAGAHLWSAAAFFFHARYFVLMSPVSLRLVCTYNTISDLLMGI